jgi:hypothetical protein
VAIRRFAATQVLVLIVSVPAGAVVPPPLLDTLAEHGCRNIPDDDEVLRYRDEWWVSLEPFTGGEGDFAFYCQSISDPASTSLVVVIRGESDVWKDCDSVVDSWRYEYAPHIPLGLEVIDIESLAVINAQSESGLYADLGRWWLASSRSDTPATPGPSGVNVPNPIIDTTGRQVGSLFTCYSGQWYAVGLD